MCSCSTKGRASFNWETEAEEKAAWTEMAEVTGKHNGITT